MALYGVAKIPLIKKLDTKYAMQKGYADDGNVVGSLQNLRETPGRCGDYRERLSIPGKAFQVPPGTKAD